MLHTKNRRRFTLELEPLESRLALSSFYVSPTGNDAAVGTINAPWKTVQHAVNSAAPGDVIDLRSGTYAGGIAINTPDLTIQSYPGERTAIVAPTNNASIGNNLDFFASGGKALNLDITGGYYYGVKFEQSGGTVDGCKVTGTGYYGIKVVPGADHVTISRTEVANTGLNGGGGGIDDVNGDYLTVSDCYIHDGSQSGIVAKGGLIGALIQRNRIVNFGDGIELGQTTDPIYMNPVENPNYYENIDGLVRNNIIQGTNYAGITISAAENPQVYNNTLIDTARVGQGSIYLTPATHNSVMTVTTSPSIVNNIVTRTVSTSLPLVFITSNGFTGTLTLDHNRYYNGGGTTSFWDERSSNGYYGTWATWPAHIGAEAGSSAGDPGIDATGHLVAGSPCIGAGRTLAEVTDDIDGDPRTGAYDIGADQYEAPAANQPPVAVAATATTVKNTPVTINVLANDYDPDGDSLTVTAVTKAAHGTVVLNADGTITYTPAIAFIGTDTFSYAISDGHGGTATAKVTVTVKRR